MFHVKFYDTEAATAFAPVTFDISAGTHTARFNADRHDRPACTERFRFTEAMHLLRHNHVLTLETTIAPPDDEPTPPTPKFWSCYHDHSEQVTRHFEPPLIPLRFVLERCEVYLRLKFSRYREKNSAMSAVFTVKPTLAIVAFDPFRKKSQQIDLQLFTSRGTPYAGPVVGQDAYILSTDLATAMHIRQASASPRGSA